MNRVCRLSVVPIAFAASLAAGFASAAEPLPGAKLGVSAQDVGAALGAEGYDMVAYEREKGRIEVTALKEGQRLEIYLDPESGEVVKIESYARRGKGPYHGSSGGLSDAQIRAQLAEAGYEVRKYEREHGEVEVYALKDGRRVELKLDPHSGRILKIEDED